MSVSTTRFLLQFQTQGLSSLINTRSTIKGVESQAYTSFNQASRSFSNLERNMLRSSNSINRSLSSILGTMRGFAGLNIGFMALGGMVSMAEKMQRAFISTNSTLQTSKIIIEELIGKGKAQGFLDMIQTKSAVYGMSLSESMSASKPMLEAMKMVTHKKGGEPTPDQLAKLLNMTYAINAMDTENRGINYTAYSFKEMMGGQGRIDFRSMKQRLGVNIGAKAETEIANLFKKGELQKGIDLFDQSLQRVGINAEKILNRLSSEGWMQNISKLQGYVSMAFQRIGEGAFLSLVKPLRGLNDFLGRQFKDGSRGSQIFKEMGTSMLYFIKPAIDYSMELGKQLYKNREAIQDLFRAMVSSIAGSGVGFLQMFSSLGKGLGGLKNDDGINSRISNIMRFMKTLTELGNQAQQFFFKMEQPLNNLGLAINKFATNLLTLLGGHSTGSGVAGLIGGLVNTGANGINMGADLIGGTNTVLGNNNNSSGGMLGFLQSSANYGLDALMLYMMLRGGKGAKVGTAGTGITMGAEGRALQQVEQTQLARGRNPQLQAMGEWRTSLNTVANNSLKAVTLAETSLTANMNQFGRLTRENSGYIALKAQKQQEVISVEGKLRRQMSALGTAESDPQKMKELQQQSLNLRNEISRIENRITDNERIKNGLKQEQINLEQNLIDKKNKHLALTNEINKKEKFFNRVQEVEENKYLNAQNIGTIANVGMTGLMAKQALGGSMSGGTGMLAKLFPTFAGAGTGMFSGLSTTILAPIATFFGTAVGTTLASIALPIITLGLTGWAVKHFAHDKILNAYDQETEQVGALDTDMGVNTRRSQRLRNQSKWFSSMGIDPIKAKNFFGSITSKEMMATRYEASSPLNQYLMDKMYEGYKNNTFGSQELNNMFGENGAKAIQSMNMVVGGNLTISGFDEKAKQELYEAVVKAGGLDKIDPNSPIKGKIENVKPFSSEALTATTSAIINGGFQ